MSRELFKHEFNEDLSASASIGEGKLSVAINFNALKEVDKQIAKLQGKSDFPSKVFGYALDFLKAQLIKEN